jgi:hypothetical protein
LSICYILNEYILYSHGVKEEGGGRASQKNLKKALGNKESVSKAVRQKGNNDVSWPGTYPCVGGIGYQVDDLFSLNPTGEELFQACKWVLNQYNSKDVREILLNFLKKRKLWVLLDKVKKEK